MDERRVIEAQLGRRPRGEVAVAVRCEYGLPMVLRTSPVLEDGEPFPTLYWLSCPLAVQKIGRLEADGAMAAYQERLAADPSLREAYRAAHEAYVRDRGDERTDSAGGMPERVKCLHALYAHELAVSNPIGEMARAEIEPLSCPGPCVEERGGAVLRVADHPAAPKRKRARR